MIDVEQIGALYAERKKSQGPLMDQMRKIRDQYNGDVVVPLPDLDRTEQSYVANLIVTGLDQMAGRCGSVIPDVYYPPLRKGIQTSEEKARKRRLANLGWWEQSRVQTKDRRRFRHLIGYASSPVIVLPDDKLRIPKWEIRNPIGCYPAPTTDPDDLCPPDVIFAVTRTWGWLRANFPLQVSSLYVGDRNRVRDDDRFDVIEYFDSDERVQAVVGRSRDQQGIGYSRDAYTSGRPIVELSRTAVRTGGMCPVVIPGRVTLDKPQGQYDQLMGMYQMQAKLMALEVIATERAVFPMAFLVSAQNSQAVINDGNNLHDGRSGLVNIVQNGQMEWQQVTPGLMTPQMIDRLERAQRIQSGTPPEFGGESTTNIRTGRRGDAVLSAVVDFPIQEAQEMLAASKVEENRRAVAVAREWFGREKQSFYVSGFKNTNAPVDYVPLDDFESDRNQVTYPLLGADVNGLTIQLGQLEGTGLISKTSARRAHPSIQDPDFEEQQINVEAAEAAVVNFVQTQIAAGQLGAEDVITYTKLIRQQHMKPEEALERVQQAAQARQAQQAALAPPPQEPSAQPGVNTGAPIPPPPAAENNLASLLNSLRRPQRTVPSETAVA